MNMKENNLECVFLNQSPTSIVFAPNYWQWFAHNKNHGTLPDEIKHCNTQLELIQYLGLDVFSRNIYCKHEDYWFGGICEEVFDGNLNQKKTVLENRDIVNDKEYQLKSGTLTEQLKYIFSESTVIQKEHLITDYASQADLLEEFVAARSWKFNPQKFEAIQNEVGENGIVVVGDFFSPLKLLHLVMNPVQTVYFLMDQAEQAQRILDMHEKAQLEAIEECVSNGVRAIMAMDNLDAMFHPPMYVEMYSASFYQKASEICHAHGAKFFIHACGNQKENLELISSLGVDGLEGVAFPPFGDVELDEAMQMTSDKFIITGGISAMEFKNLTTKEAVFDYVKNLFERMKPYKNRFIFAASCNTPFDAKWETIEHFRDAWLEYKDC